jgi:hypothetical protein
MKIKLSYILGAILAVSCTASSFGWWANPNPWGVSGGTGGYATFNCYRSGNDLVTNWTGVWRKPNTWVQMYPSAVEGWQWNGAWYVWVPLNKSTSSMGCYFSPSIANGWDADDVWDISLDIWCFNNVGGYQTDEVMMWNSWKNLNPAGAFAGSRSGYEYWEGWIGWTVHSLRSWGKSGSIDVKQLCLQAGVPSYRANTGVQAGAEVCAGSASVRLSNYNTWWQN